MSNLPTAAAPGSQERDMIFNFEGTDIHCPFESGTVMVPVRSICQLIDIDFAKQNNWLKKHPVYAQLYTPRPTTGADGKQYSMSCLPMVAASMWLSGITESQERKPGSVKKQHALMVWFLAKIAETYKSVQALRYDMNRYDLLLRKKEELEITIANSHVDIKDKQKLLRQIDANLDAITRNTFSPQYELPFPDVLK